MAATDAQTLQKVAREVKEDLLADPQITKLTAYGLLPYEVRVEVDEEKMRAHGVTLTDVASAINQASLDYRTGSIKSDTGKVVIRADRKAFNYEEFVAIPLHTRSDGTRILIQDVAQVFDDFEEVDSFARFDGAPSVALMVYTSKKGHLLQVSTAAHKVVDALRPALPKGIKVDIWGEYSTYMKARLQLLAANGAQGLLIVFALLALFLNFRLAFWVAMGIPISIAGALVLMGDRFLGYSLNDITTFGLIIVLGILVDDAIVVGESVYEERGKTDDPLQGTINGVQKVSTATIFGCFTTIAAFFPLLLIDNDLGKIFASFSVVVIVSLLVSLVESKLILPAHLAAIHIGAPSSRNVVTRSWNWIQARCSEMLDAVNRHWYQPALIHVLRHRYSAMVVLLSTAIVGIAMIFNGQVRTVFFPDVPGQIITVTMGMRSGVPLSLTLDNMRKIEQAADEINAEAMVEFHTDTPPIKHVLSFLAEPCSVELYAELQPEKIRQLDTLETLRRWREKVGVLEGTEKLTFSGSFETGGGFVVELADRSMAVLDGAETLFAEKLRQLKGVNDVRSDLKQGSPQIRLHLKPEAEHLGLTVADLAGQIGDAFGGVEVQRVQRGADEVKVNVRYRETRRRYIRDIMNMRIQSASGRWLPLSLVARVESGYVPSEINRKNGRRVIEIKANLDKEIISSSEAATYIKEHIEPELKRLYPSLTLSGGGELEEIGEMQTGLKGALIMIVILIYALLAIPLKSYWKPFVIMSVIPFGFVGAVLGHWVMGVPLSLLSFFGMLAVMGVVVNDSLVMLTRYNELREEGEPLACALIQAGGSRFRAILLTTATTVCGLMPLLSETSEQAQYLIPAAISLAWGELFATPITLFIVPVLIRIAGDFQGGATKMKRWISG